jgi:nucleoside 2-deoxyribosyltransferase
MERFTRKPEDGLTGSPVYCAGPMFSQGEKAEQERMAKALEDGGYETYVPQRDGIEVGKVMTLLRNPNPDPELLKDATEKVRPWVFALDMYQTLERCGSVVYNIDGRTPDEGGAVEAAAAFAAGKPIMIFKTSPISLIDGTDNPMIQGMSYRWMEVGEDSELPKALGEAIAASDHAYRYDPPRNIAAVVREGKAVWDALQKEEVRRLTLEQEAELKTWMELIDTEVKAQLAPTPS